MRYGWILFFCLFFSLGWVAPQSVEEEPSSPI